MKVEIISATRLSRENFAKSALSQSLQRLAYDPRVFMRIVLSNTRALPQVYNQSIAAADPDSIVVLVHDDVWIEDYYLCQRLAEGLARYDVIGVAGNRRRVPGQPAWAFLDESLQWDDKGNLSGAVAHGEYPFGMVRHYGESPADCELLDGVFLAARKSVLAEKRVGFDPRFAFDFYDMDFCRAARASGLRLGTWPVCLTHQSHGTGFGSERWKQGYRTYLEKWGS
jgi:GT2 family glycosyltransferase